MHVCEPRKGFPGCQMQEVWVRSLGQEEPLETEMATPPVFYLGNPMAQELRRAPVHGVIKRWP